MKQTKRKLGLLPRGFTLVASGLLTAVAGLPRAQAASTWQLDSHCVSSSCVKTDATVKATADSTSLTAGSNLAAAPGLTGYSSGPDVNQEGTGVPHRAPDNQGNQEMILQQFTQAVTLTSLNIGWADYDSDIMAMIYQDPITANASATAGAAVTAKNISNLNVATAGSNGWNLVGSYTEVLTGDETINASNLSSSWWLISAYNSTIGGTLAGAENGTGHPSTANGSLPTATEINTDRSSGYDYVKLFSFTGGKSAVTTNGNTVLKPFSLALASLALFGLFYARRHRNV